MEQPKKRKIENVYPPLVNSSLEQMVAALASNPNVYPKLTEPSLVATARKILAEIDKLG